MKLSTTLLYAGFVGILVNPIPGLGGKVPAISQAHLSHLAALDVLLLVLVIAILQVYLMTRWADWISTLIDRSRLGRWLRAKFGQRKRQAPQTTHPAARYGVVFALPIMPFGGGLYGAIALKEVWQLDPRLSVPLTAAGNWLGFLWTYYAAAALGVTGFVLLFASVVALALVATKSRGWIRSRRPALT